MKIHKYKDYDDYVNDPEYDARNGRIDIDYLAGDFLPDLLDAVEELLRTTEELGDAQAGTGNIGGWALKGAQFGLNNDSQYNVFEEDGKLVVYRNVNGVISITFGAGASFSLSTDVDGYQGTNLGNGGAADLTFDVSDITDQRAAGTYTIGASDYSVSPTGGTGATFSVVVDGSGNAAITITDGRTGYSIDNHISISDCNLGSAGS